MTHEQQIATRRLPSGSTEELASKFVDRLCELMAAHELVWRNGGQIEGARLVRDEAVKELCAVLEKAGCLYVPDDKNDRRRT